MGIAKLHLRVASPRKRPGTIVGRTGAEAAGEYGISSDSTRERRSRIILSYLRVIEDMRGPIAVDCDLPFPKEQIGQAILCELAEDPDSDLRRRLEIAFVLLESFIPYEEYRVIEDFKSASLWAMQIADMGDPTSIIRSARIVRKAKGDSAVRLQEKIYKKMRKRQLLLLQLQRGDAA